ncbi:MAG: UTP--glucose-1-phosphate uridylyltransferase [Flaviflexus sp.]|nr:UTP--glucose-1-phosphate uridylyltransferase [Flaviflexus sp.]
MREAGLDDQVINLLSSQIDHLAAGSTGHIPEASIDPVTEVETMPSATGVDPEALSRTALIKLNGGLGTSMGMNTPKSLLPVTAGRTFLDIIITQVLAARRAYGVTMPLVLMNSFRTEQPTLEFCDRYPELAVPGVSLSMRQNQIPKLTQELLPVSWPENPELEWCPPGHGDLYATLVSSGVLDELLEAGMSYALVSNADNLGAFPDPGLARWFAGTGAVMALEVCERTEADRKGGHLARRRRDGKLILREIAQVPSHEIAEFQNIERHRYFNTNNIWLNLRMLRDHLDEDGFVAMPIIRNIKPVDPTRPDTPKVIQVETGMGTAIESFDSARAIEVPRSRFLPVKTTNDLFFMRSDLVTETDEGRIVAKTDRRPIIDLDPRFFARIDDFNERCEHVPSLARVESLTVRGDLTFPEGLELSGNVRLEGTV